MKKILELPSKILREKSSEVETIDKHILDLAKTLENVLVLEDKGIGLAAPQIGTSVRMIAIGARELKDENGKIIQKEIPFSIYINPKITKFSKELTEMEEGCLSYPCYYGMVSRPKKVRFSALDLKGKIRQVNASGLLARIVQHEIDHLDGILFIDRVTDKSKIRKIELKSDK